MSDAGSGKPVTGEGPAAPRTGLPAPLWIGLLTLAILALLAYIGRGSFAA